MATEQFGDIVIAPRVLEKIIAIATAKVEGVYSLENKSVSDSLSKRSLGRGVYLHTEEDGQVSVDIYLYLEYGVAVPSVAVAIQKAVKSAVYDMADVTLDAVNIHVVGIATEKSPKPDLKDLFNEDFRERAFQALMALEYDGDIVEACHFAYLHDKDLAEDKEVDLPAFLMNLVTGVYQSKDQLDQQIGQHLKTGWTVERLTLVEKNILRLGIYEMTEFDTPQIVAVNEAVELAKAFSDETSSRFVNGVLSQFVTEE